MSVEYSLVELLLVVEHVNTTKKTTVNMIINCSPICCNCTIEQIRNYLYVITVKLWICFCVLSAKVTHNLTFRLCLIELVGIETIVRTVTLDIASPKVRWCAPLSDGSIRVQHAEVAIVAGRLLNAVDVLMGVGIRLVEFVKHACILQTVVSLYKAFRTPLTISRSTCHKGFE